MSGRRVIYSAIVGGYDYTMQPKAVHPLFDYILFSNDIEAPTVGVWQVRPIPYQNADNVRVARWVKTHPHILLPDYDYCVWLDSNVCIVSEEIYTIFEHLYSTQEMAATFAHPERKCIYEEGLAVIQLNRDTMDRVLPEMLFLKRQGYPKNNGLCETNCLFMQHRKPQCQDFLYSWWQMIDKFSRRDQLSFNYVLWKHHIVPQYLLPKEYSSRNHPFFECYEHTTTYTQGEQDFKYFLLENEDYATSYWNLISSPPKSWQERVTCRRFVINDYILHRKFLFPYIENLYRTLQSQRQMINSLECEKNAVEQEKLLLQEQLRILQVQHNRLIQKNMKHLSWVRGLCLVIVIGIILFFVFAFI